MINAQSMNLEPMVRQFLQSIVPTYTNIEGHLILYDPITANRMSLFFREDDPRPPSNTSTASFPTPNSKCSSSGETSPSHRRKPLHPTRMVDTQDTPLNLSAKRETEDEYNCAQLPSRELFPPSLFSTLMLQQHFNLLASQQQPPVLPFTTASVSPPMDTKPVVDAKPAKIKTPKLSMATSSPGAPPRRRINNPRTPTTPGKSRRFSCNQCGSEFLSLATLSEHTSSVHGTYRCSLCPTEFTQRSNLQRHALKHVGFKPFECRVCGRAYYRKDHLARHVEQTHPEVEPRSGIQVKLSASESLNYIQKMMQNGDSADEQPLSDDEVNNNNNCARSVTSEEERVCSQPGTVLVKPEHASYDEYDDMDIDIVH